MSIFCDFEHIIECLFCFLLGSSELGVGKLVIIKHHLLIHSNHGNCYEKQAHVHACSFKILIGFLKMYCNWITMKREHILTLTQECCV